MNRNFLIFLIIILIFNSLSAQNLKISGRLTDSFNVALPKGEIFLQEKNLTTYSNENGYFEFDKVTESLRSIPSMNTSCRTSSRKQEADGSVT